MNPTPAPLQLHSIVAFDNERGDAADGPPFGMRGGKTQAPGQYQTEVLVLGEAVEVFGGRLQDMRSGRTPLWYAPTIVLPIEIQSSLCLGTGKRELPFCDAFPGRTRILG